ncbi:MAG TPA: TetR/AcrR family transcriptional regulator, partial [Cellulomonas sp.]
MTTAKGMATRARIVEAAVDRLVVGGVANFNVDEVLHTTRTSKGQLFHYFPNGKDELCAAATERQVDRLLATSRSERLDNWQAWDRWVDATVRRHEQQSRDDACQVAAMAGRVLDTEPGLRSLVAQAYERWAGQIAGDLERMRADGLLRADAPVDDLASTVLAVLQGGAVIDKATGSHDHLRRALHQAV